MPFSFSTRPAGIRRPKTHRAGQHHARATATALSGAQPGRKTSGSTCAKNWLSNRIFNSYDDILGICCEAWNKLVDLPETITSIGLREWAYPS